MSVFIRTVNLLSPGREPSYGVSQYGYNSTIKRIAKNLGLPTKEQTTFRKLGYITIKDETTETYIEIIKELPEGATLGN